MPAEVSEIHDYMRYARECRELAAKLWNVEYRRMLEAMSGSWTDLAAKQRALMRGDGR